LTKVDTGELPSIAPVTFPQIVGGPPAPSTQPLLSPGSGLQPSSLSWASRSDGSQAGAALPEIRAARNDRKLNRAEDLPLMLDLRLEPPPGNGLTQSEIRRERKNSEIGSRPLRSAVQVISSRFASAMRRYLSSRTYPRLMGL